MGEGGEGGEEKKREVGKGESGRGEGVDYKHNYTKSLMFADSDYCYMCNNKTSLTMWI